MLVIKVELHSAITGQTSEIANMVIANNGKGSHSSGDYWGRVYKKGTNYYNKPVVIKDGEVKNYPRLDKPVWNLVQLMLTNMGYGDVGE